jgi:hypothetical protein
MDIRGLLKGLLLRCRGLCGRLRGYSSLPCRQRVGLTPGGHVATAAALMLAGTIPVKNTGSGRKAMPVIWLHPSAAEARKVPRGTLKAGGKAQGLCRGQCTRLSPDPLRQLAPPLSCRGHRDPDHAVLPLSGRARHAWRLTQLPETSPQPAAQGSGDVPRGTCGLAERNLW